MRRDLVETVALDLSVHDPDGVIDRSLAVTAIESVFHYIIARQMTIGDVLSALKPEA